LVSMTSFELLNSCYVWSPVYPIGHFSNVKQ
jgi:hypothetical protein